MKKQQVQLTIVLAIYLVMVVVFASITPLFDEDEGFVAEATRNMLAQSDFLKIQVNGEIRYDKPILFFLFQAMSFAVFGLKEFAARLPSILCTIVQIYLLFKVCKQFAFNFTRTVLFFTCSLQFVLVNNAGIFESMLMLWMSISMYYLFQFLQNGVKQHLWWFYFFCGLGFITKGPVAIVIPVIVYILYSLRYKNWKAFFSIVSPIGIGLFLLVVVPWFLMAYHKVGWVVIEDFFIKHNLSRFGKTMESHGGSYFYFFPVLLLGFLPFTGLLFRLFTQLKIYIINPLTFYLITWFSVVFVLFSFSQTKLPHYILYGYIPLILLLSRVQSTTSKRWIDGTQLVLLALFISAPSLISMYRLMVEDVYFLEQSKSILLVFSGAFYWLMGACLLITLLSYLHKVPEIYARLAFGLSINVIIYFFSILQQQPVKNAAAFAKANQLEVVTRNHYLPSFSFYRQQTTAIVEHPVKGQIVLVKTGELPSEAYQPLFEQYGILLVKIK